MDIKDPTSLQEIVNQTTLGYWNTAIGRIHDSNNILGTGTTWKRFFAAMQNDETTIYAVGLSMILLDEHGASYVCIGGNETDGYSIQISKSISFSDHTHNYAASTSPGGKATSAVSADTATYATNVKEGVTIVTPTFRWYLKDGTIDSPYVELRRTCNTGSYGIGFVYSDGTTNKFYNMFDANGNFLPGLFTQSNNTLTINY